VVLISAIVAQHGYEGLVYTTIIAGVLLMILGITKTGSLIKFIPYPVITSFTTGIAVVIFSTQIKDFLGLNLPNPSADFLPKWRDYFTHFHTLDPSTAGIGFLTLAVILAIGKFFPRWPSMILGLIIAAFAAWILHLDVETVGTRFGDLPRFLPKPAFPSFEAADLTRLISPAFTIAMLAAIESLLSATVADGMIGGKHRSNMELVGGPTSAPPFLAAFPPPAP